MANAYISAVYINIIQHTKRNETKPNRTKPIRLYTHVEKFRFVFRALFIFMLFGAKFQYNFTHFRCSPVFLLLLRCCCVCFFFLSLSVMAFWMAADIAEPNAVVFVHHLKKKNGIWLSVRFSTSNFLFGITRVCFFLVFLYFGWFLIYLSLV